MSGRCTFCAPALGDLSRFFFSSDDFAFERIDLNEELVRHQQATFLVRVSGDSMREAGIFDGDTPVANSAVKPRHSAVVNLCCGSQIGGCAP